MITSIKLSNVGNTRILTEDKPFIWVEERERQVFSVVCLIVDGTIQAKCARAQYSFTDTTINMTDWLYTSRLTPGHTLRRGQFWLCQKICIFFKFEFQMWLHLR